MCTETVITHLQATQDFNNGSSVNTVSVKILIDGKESTGAATDTASIINALGAALLNAVGSEKKLSWRTGERGKLTISLDGKDVYIKNGGMLVLANAILVLIDRN